MHPKHLQVLFVFAAIFSCVTLRSQNTTIGFLDQNDAPISGAFWRVDSTRFGVSDKLGFISLTRVGLSSEEVQLSVSHISFRDTVFVVNPSAGKNLQLTLQLDNVALPEISVVGGKPRKFRSPQHLLRMALRAKKKNYPDEITQRTSLYREILTYQDCPVNLNEGLLEMEISPYTDKFRLRKSWSEGWDRNYASYVVPHKGKYRALGLIFPEGTQQYAAVNDRYRVLNSRVSTNDAPHDFSTYFRDGPLMLLALDKVRLGYDYLAPKLLKEYEYSLVDSVFVNNAYCYHLSFAPANDKPTKYIPLSKQQSVGAFSGEIFLDMKSLAIVRFNAVNAKRVARGPSTSIRRAIPIGALSTAVNYARTGNGKWQLVEAVNTHMSTDTNYKAVRTLYLTDEDLEGRSKNASRWRYHNFMWTLRKLTRSYDEQYWSAFELSSFYQRAKLVSFDCSVASQPGAKEFRAPFLRDTVYQPSAAPMRNRSFVKEKRIRNAWEWLEDPADSATTAYLKWENDYYDQYFYPQQDELEDVSAQFSRQAQGMPPRTASSVAIDTVFRRINGQLGFYRIVPDKDATLLIASGPVTAGYIITDYGWNNDVQYYYAEE